LRLIKEKEGGSEKKKGTVATLRRLFEKFSDETQKEESKGKKEGR